MKKHQLYIDKEGVERGFYVYLHKSKKSGEVFYIGKGTDKRAWETQNRNQNWKDRVIELDGEWEVEIYRDDLSEIEAFNLEEKLVKEHGFFDENNNQLTNRFPGGEQPASFTLSFGSDEVDEWKEVYYQERKFKDIGKENKKELANNVQKKLREIYWELNKIDNETEFPEDEEVSDHSAYMLIGAFEDPMIGGEEFLKERISWKEFCLDLEYSLEYFQSRYPDDKINKEKFSDEVFELFLTTRSIISEAYKIVDTGNKDEASELASQAATNIPIEISSRIPNKANCIQLSSKMTVAGYYQKLLQLFELNGFKIAEKDAKTNSFSTDFKEFSEKVRLKIDVEIKESNNTTNAILKGKSGIYFSHDPQFSNENKRNFSVEAVWDEIKSSREAFGLMAVIATQVNHEKVVFKCD